MHTTVHSYLSSLPGILNVAAVYLMFVVFNSVPRKYLGKLYTDSLVHDEDALKYLVSTLGEDNVVLGTDYPFPLGEHHPGKLIESVEGWSHDTKVLR